MGHVSSHTVAGLRNQPSSAALIIEALRCWRGARDQQTPTLPALFSFLTPYPYRFGMLAPAFDSVMRIYEIYLGRPIQSGVGNVLSLDEDVLLRLIGLHPPLSPNVLTPRAPSAGALLDSAISSTRLLLALAAQAPEIAALRPGEMG